MGFSNVVGNDDEGSDSKNDSDDVRFLISIAKNTPIATHTSLNK